jgi:hypothetical protein
MTADGGVSMDEEVIARGRLALAVIATICVVVALAMPAAIAAGSDGDIAQLYVSPVTIATIGLDAVLIAALFASWRGVRRPRHTLAAAVLVACVVGALVMLLAPQAAHLALLRRYFEENGSGALALTLLIAAIDALAVAAAAGAVASLVSRRFAGAPRRRPQLVWRGVLIALGCLLGLAQVGFILLSFVGPGLSE